MKPPSLLSLALTSTVTGLVAGFQYPDCVSGPLASNTVCDPKASPPDRAASLVKAMNITEKLVNLVEYGTPSLTSSRLNSILPLITNTV